MPRASFRIEVVLILCFVALFSCFASAQGDPGTGLPAFGTFNSGAIDTIYLGNLNIHVQVPLFRKKGRNLDVGLQILHDNTLYRPKYRNSAYTWDQDTLLGHEIWGVGVTTGGVGGSITFTPQSFSSQDQTCFDGVGYRDYQHFADFVFIDANGTNHSFGGAYVAIPSFCVTPQSTTGYSGDGYILHVTIDDSGNFTDKRVIDPAGNVMDYVAGTITDPNGNTISGSGTLTDTTGSTPLSFSGTALTSTFSYPNPSGGDPENITTTFSNAFTLQTNFQCPGIPDINPQGAGGTYLTTGVSLPDGTSYAFTYESTNGTYPSNVVTGRIHSITLPSGGVITYTYSGGTNGINCRDGSPATLTKQTPDGTWTYNHYYTATDQFHGLWTTKVTDPQGNDTVYTFGSVPTSETPQSSTLETQRIEYQGSQASGNWLRKTVTCYNGNFTGCETSNNLQGNSAIYVTRKDVYTYLKDAPAPSLSEVFYKVGSPQLVTQANEFDFGVNTGAAPTTTPVKATIITHANVGNNILTRPECIQVTAGSSPATCGTVTAATNSITNYLNYDSHGNVGTIQNLKSGSTYLSRAFTYFANGLVHTETDFRQTPTTYTYGNCNGSFPTQISKAGLSRQMTWNCNGGVVTSTTDENSKTTNYSYVNPDTGAGDPFWRLTQVTYPDGGRTTRTYNNTANHINITTAELIDAGHSLTTQTNFDVLHRPTLEMTTSDPGGTVYRATTYDELGRVKRSYNPTRCNPATTNCGESTWGYTEYSYDGLSRPIQVKNQDGTTISTSYQGRAAKVQDEGNGTQRVTRISQSDALGRVTSVCEVASSSGTPTACGQDLAANGYLTTYSYDALGNLTAVNQAGVNQRQFYYDGLSRLTNASNPESGAITYNYDADSLCATPNSFAGELVSKLDARGVRTCMQYDTLNHLTQKTYSDGTPTVTYNYGESSALGVTFTNTVGRRSSETTGGPNPTGSAFSYDSMGRVVTNSQCTPFNCASNGHYDLSYTYNLDGSVHTANNSQVTLTYGYDNAGQLGSVARSLSGGTHPGNLFTNASYGPLGLSQV